MCAKKKPDNQIALSQSEVDKILGKIQPTPKPVKITTTKETEEKIKKLKAKTRKVELKLKNEDKAKKQAEAKAKIAENAKTQTKFSVYYNGKMYGTAKLSTKNGKQIVELLTIKK